MVKAYLRYELADTWGVITSRADVCHATHGKYLFAASLERVAVWDVKQAVMVRYTCGELCDAHVFMLVVWYCSFVHWMFLVLGLGKVGQ